MCVFLCVCLLELLQLFGAFAVPGYLRSRSCERLVPLFLCCLFFASISLSPSSFCLSLVSSHALSFPPSGAHLLLPVMNLWAVDTSLGLDFYYFWCFRCCSILFLHTLPCLFVFCEASYCMFLCLHAYFPYFPCFIGCVFVFL
jgi:hypothetical protein